MNPKTEREAATHRNRAGDFARERTIKGQIDKTAPQRIGTTDTRVELYLIASCHPPAMATDNFIRMDQTIIFRCL